MGKHLDAIRRRATAATAAPWFSVGLPWNNSTPFVIAGHPDPHFGTFVCDLANFGDEDNDNAVADAEFIAHARSDVESLLATVDELSAALKAAQVIPLGEHRVTPEGYCQHCGRHFTTHELDRLRERNGSGLGEGVATSGD